MIFLRIILAMIFFIGIILIGTFILSFITDLIISLFDNHKGVYFNRMDWREEVEGRKEIRRNEIVKDENDIVVLKSDAPKETSYTEVNNSFVSDEENITEIDFDKAVQEQKELQEKLNKESQAESVKQESNFSAVNDANVKVLIDHAKYSHAQTAVPGNFWSAPETFAKSVTAGLITDAEKLQEALTTMNNSIKASK